MKNPRAATQADLEVGSAIRRIRRGRDMSLEYLSEQIGVTWQQLQKYETGRNRISVSRLAAISIAMEAPIAEICAGIGYEAG